METHNKVKVVLDFKISSTETNKILLHLESLSALQDPQYIMNVFYESLMPRSTSDTTMHVVCILHANYKKAYLQDISAYVSVKANKNPATLST